MTSTTRFCGPRRLSTKKHDKIHASFAPAYRSQGGVPRTVVVHALYERQQANRDELERRVEGDVMSSLLRLYLAGHISGTCVKAFRSTLPAPSNPWKEGELFQ